MSRPFRLTVYTDAYELGGAEQSVRHLLANVGDHASVSVLGVDGDVADWIAASRPGTTVRVVRPVRGKVISRPLIDHARAIRELRPDIFHANLRTTFACRYGILAALALSGRARCGRRAAAYVRGVVLSAPPQTSCIEAACRPHCGRRAGRGLTEEIVGLPAGSVRTIHNGVPMEDVRTRDRAASGAVVGALGRIVHQKGLRRIRASSRIARGGHGDRRRRRARAGGSGGARRGARRVRPPADHGLAGRTAFLSLEHRRLLSPLAVRGLPLAVVEAMLAGLPIVASDVGSVSEAIRDRRPGSSFPPKTLPLSRAPFASCWTIASSRNASENVPRRSRWSSSPPSAWPRRTRACTTRFSAARRECDRAPPAVPSPPAVSSASRLRPARGTATAALVGVVEDRCSGSDQCFRLGLHDHPRPTVDALGAERRSHHGNATRKRLERLHLDPASSRQRIEENG